MTLLCAKLVEWGVAALMATALLTACAVTTPLPATPQSATAPPAFPAVLYIDGRGNPPIIVSIGDLEVARFACGVSSRLTPGEKGVPPLPWSLSVGRQSDGATLLSETVSELPRWLIMFGDEAGLSTNVVLGPFVACPSNR